jgi:hypothetical protein
VKGELAAATAPNFEGDIKNRASAIAPDSGSSQRPCPRVELSKAIRQRYRPRRAFWPMLNPAARTGPAISGSTP